MFFRQLAPQHSYTQQQPNNTPPPKKIKHRDPAAWVRGWVKLAKAIDADPVARGAVLFDLVNEPDNERVFWHESQYGRPALAKLYIDAMDAVYSVKQDAIFVLEVKCVFLCVVVVFRCATSLSPRVFVFALCAPSSLTHPPHTTTKTTTTGHRPVWLRHPRRRRLCHRPQGHRLLQRQEDVHQPLLRHRHRGPQRVFPDIDEKALRAERRVGAALLRAISDPH